MDIVGRAILAVDRHFRDQGQPEFSEQLFYNVGKLYTGGLLVGAFAGACTSGRARAPRKSQFLDSVAHRAWRSSLTAAKAAFLFTPIEAVCRKELRVEPALAQDVAWGAAWACAQRGLTLRSRAALGLGVGISNYLLRTQGAAITQQLQAAEVPQRLWNRLPQLRRPQPALALDPSPPTAAA